MSPCRTQRFIMAGGEVKAAREMSCWLPLCKGNFILQNSFVELMYGYKLVSHVKANYIRNSLSLQ